MLDVVLEFDPPPTVSGLSGTKRESAYQNKERGPDNDEALLLEFEKRRVREREKMAYKQREKERERGRERKRDREKYEEWK